MKVLNLQCSRRHSFEGWFGSEDDFQSQLARGLIECPLCEDKGIQKMPSAPRLNFGGHQARDGRPANHDQAKSLALPDITASNNVAAPGDPAQKGRPEGFDPAVAQAAFLNAMRHLVATTEDVGQRFADEARRMHYGEVEARSIRGQSTAREAVELLEEGIEVMALPMLAALKETLQ
jgi:hypothetical protein